MKYTSKSKPIFFAVIVMTLLIAGTAFSQTRQRSARGTITGITGSGITLKSADGSSLKVLFDAKTVFFLRAKADLASIKPGDALGVTSRPSGNGAMTAEAITIFPPGLLEHIRNGQFPMGNSGNTMTNAVVSRYALGVSGHTLKMKLNGGISDFQVPDGISVERLTVMHKTDLRANSIVSVRGIKNPDGSMMAGSVVMQAS